MHFMTQYEKVLKNVIKSLWTEFSVGNVAAFIRGIIIQLEKLWTLLNIIESLQKL